MFQLEVEPTNKLGAVAEEGQRMEIVQARKSIVKTADIF